MAVRSKPGICLGNSVEEEVEGAVCAMDRTAASSIERAKIILIRIFASLRKFRPAANSGRSGDQGIGPRASCGGRKLAKHTTGNTTTRAIRLGNSCRVSRNKILLPLKRASGGWSGISWGLCGRPRSGFVFPPVIGRHCCTTKDLPGICRRCLRLCPAGQRCCSGG